MKSIFDAISAFFEKEKWQVQRVGSEPAFSMRFKGSHAEWICIAQAFEDERRFVFYSACPVNAPREACPAVAELLSRINYCLVFGNFELGYLDGQVRFRTSIEVPDQELAPLMVDRVVYNNIASMEIYLPALLAVIQKGAAPLDAIAKVLG